MSTATIADVLDGTADEIEDLGWWAGPEREPGGFAAGKHCVLQALYAVALRSDPRYFDRSSLSWKSCEYFSEFVDAPLEADGVRRPDQWNDAQLDGAAVVNTLRKAAAAWRAERALDVDA